MTPKYNRFDHERMLDTKLNAEYYPDKHRIYTPSGYTDVPTWAATHGIAQFAQPVMFKHVHWDNIEVTRQYTLFPWWFRQLFFRFARKQLRKVDFSFGPKKYWVKCDIYIYDAARIFLGEQTRDVMVEDFTERNKDWWIIASTSHRQIEKVDTRNKPQPAYRMFPGDWWKFVDSFCEIECEYSFVAEQIASAKQAHHTLWVDYMVEWNDHHMHDEDYVAAGFPLQAVAQKYHMEVLPCIGLGISHFFKHKPYDNDWREWLAEDEEWEEIPSGEPCVTKIIYNMNDFKSAFSGCRIEFSVPDLYIDVVGVEWF